MVMVMNQASILPTWIPPRGGLSVVHPKIFNGYQKVARKVKFRPQAKPPGPFEVAVAGATGLIGTRLIHCLMLHKCKVKILTRDVRKAVRKLPQSGLDFFDEDKWESAICGCNAVINLAGEPIATRWSKEIKREIKESRVKTTSRLVSAINCLPDQERPKVLVNASAVGYYGASLTECMKESSPNGSDYLAEICREWEYAASEASSERVVILRLGIVLAPQGGALGRMVPIFQMFAGGPIGNGQQWVSWIHIDDVAQFIWHALRNSSMQGIYNATAPNPVRMGEFCNVLGQVIGRPSWLPVPDIALKGLLDDGAMMVVQGQRVLPTRITNDTKYRFRYPTLRGALRNLLT